MIAQRRALAMVIATARVDLVREKAGAVALVGRVVALAKGVAVSVIVRAKDAAVLAIVPARVVVASATARAIAVHVGSVVTATLAVNAGHGVTAIVRAVAADSAIAAMTAACRAPRASVTNGASARTAFVTPDVRAATRHDVVSADGRLDRGDRGRDVQRQERRAHSPR
jgi:hypothetical protein